MPRRQYPIRMDLKEVEKRTAARDAAAEERRLRERFGSTRDALNRARRVQGEEARESETAKYEKGGKVMKKSKGAAKTRKFAVGGAPAATAAPARLGVMPTLTRTQSASRAAVNSPAAKPAGLAASRQQVPADRAPAGGGLTREQYAREMMRKLMSSGQMPSVNSGTPKSGTPAPRGAGPTDLTQHLAVTAVKPGMKKGGKVMKHASKAGNAMKRKSADTMGRAMKMAKGGSMKKYAKGGSIDGCATKGKTKGKMVTMARGGMTGGCK